MDRENIKDTLRKFSKEEVCGIFFELYAESNAKTIDVLPEDWRDFVLTEMEEGANLVFVLKYFGIDRQVHARFMVEYPEYEQAMNWGKILHDAYWIDWARKNLLNKSKAQVSLWYMYMKNNLGYRDIPLSANPNVRDLRDVTTENEMRTKYKKVKKEIEKLN